VDGLAAQQCQDTIYVNIKISMLIKLETHSHNDLNLSGIESPDWAPGLCECGVRLAEVDPIKQVENIGSHIYLPACAQKDLSAQSKINGRK
jgi:hypothetical protein